MGFIRNLILGKLLFPKPERTARRMPLPISTNLEWVILSKSS
jgi:hypothetical protein